MGIVQKLFAVFAYSCLICITAEAAVLIAWWATGCNWELVYVFIPCIILAYICTMVWSVVILFTIVIRITDKK